MLTSAPLPLREELMRQVPWGRILGWVRRVSLVPLVLAGAMLLFGYQARMRLIDQKGSYCHHLDEHLWTSQAIRILKTGDLNPHRFTKPSVMVYLDTAGFALGLLKTGMKGTSVPAISELRAGAYPYYTSPSMVRVVRQIYAMLSIASIAMVGLLARHLVRKMSPVSRTVGSSSSDRPILTEENAAGLIAVGTTLLSEFYLRYSHLYLGVDILGCFFGILTISYVVLARPSTRASTFAIVAGILSGLCLGTKYNLYPIAIPAMLGIFLRHRVRLLPSLVLFCLSLGATFILTTPYAILDLPHFVESAVAEARHYARGHGGHDATPGLSLFWAYGRPVVTAYGFGLLLLALSGAGVALRRAPRQAILILSYPLLLWIYMSGQRVVFTRNLLILQLILPIFAALGALFVPRMVPWFLAQRGLRRHPMQRLTVPLLVSLTLASVPWPRVVEGYRAAVESRSDLAEWFAARPEPAILVAEELEFDPRSLPGKKIVSYAAKGANLSKLRRENPGAVIVVPIFEGKVLAPHGTSSDVLWSGGRNRVRVDRERFSGSHISDGNPKMIVYRNPWSG